MTALLRTVTLRLARAGCGTVDFWMGLPIYEVVSYLFELMEQLEAEQKAAEDAARRR